MSSWNYFEQARVIGFGVDEKAVACKIDNPESIIYWVLDDVQGYRLIEIKVAK